MVCKLCQAQDALGILLGRPFQGCIFKQNVDSGQNLFLDYILMEIMVDMVDYEDKIVFQLWFIFAAPTHLARSSSPPSPYLTYGKIWSENASLL